MRKVYIGFSTPKKWNIFSWLIRKIEGTEFSHIYLRLPTGRRLKQDLIYQASNTMVHFVGSKRFEEKNTILKEIEFDIETETYYQLLRFCVEEVGKPYAFLQILGIAWVLLFRCFGIKKRNPFAKGKGSYVCSELVAAILIEFFGYRIMQDLDLITPKEVYELLTNLE